MKVLKTVGWIVLISVVLATVVLVVFGGWMILQGQQQVASEVQMYQAEVAEDLEDMRLSIETQTLKVDTLAKDLKATGPAPSAGVTAAFAKGSFAGCMAAGMVLAPPQSEQELGKLIGACNGVSANQVDNGFLDKELPGYVSPIKMLEKDRG